jgi:hypothetical protein
LYQQKIHIIFFAFFPGLDSQVFDFVDKLFHGRHFVARNFWPRGYDSGWILQPLKHGFRLPSFLYYC